MQEHRLQLAERDRPVRQAVERGAVEGERVGAGDEKIEGLLQGVERRVGEDTAGDHGQLLSLRSRHQATGTTPLFPRIDPTHPCPATTPDAG